MESWIYGNIWGSIDSKTDQTFIVRIVMLQYLKKVFSYILSSIKREKESYKYYLPNFPPFIPMLCVCVCVWGGVFETNSVNCSFIL